ncbi:MAG: cytochrome-c peroxidase [Bacteriovoracia bacterium]
MLFFLSLLVVLPMTFAQEELDFYIQRFNYRALQLPQKQLPLFKLGSHLFRDEKISGAGNVSCQSCHSDKGFGGDALPLGLGEGAVGEGEKRIQRNGLVLKRHSQNIYNVGHPELRNHFWDGRVANTFRNGWFTPEPQLNGLHPELEEVAKTFSSVTAVQSVFPFTSPEEMLGKDSRLSRIEAWDLVLQKIFKGPSSSLYKKLFADAFPEAKEYNIGHVGNALAEFMRHQFAAVNTPWDLYLRGRREVLTERMKKGAILFHSKAGCFRCHNRDHFSNFTFHNIGVPQIGPDDKGQYLVTGIASDMYEFRVPALRNVGVTAPYMHSGAFKNLREVIDHYNEPISSLRNFRWNPRHPNYRELLVLDSSSTNNTQRERTLSPMLAKNLNLTEGEKEDLICFLGAALTDVSLQKEIMKKGIVKGIPDCFK